MAQGKLTTYPTSIWEQATKPSNRDTTKGFKVFSGPASLRL